MLFEPAFGLLLRLVLVVGVFFLVQYSQSFGLFDEALALALGQQFPPTAEFLRNFGVVFIGGDFDDLSTLQLTPNHKSVHRAFDMIRRMLFGLWKN